jgi:hypothetical protein
VNNSQVFCGDFWLGAFGAASPKRLRLRSNDRFIQHIIDGATRMTKVDMKILASKTVRKYCDSRGKKRFVGTPELKKSQFCSHCLGLIFDFLSVLKSVMFVTDLGSIPKRLLGVSLKWQSVKRPNFAVSLISSVGLMFLTWAGRICAANQWTTSL